MQRLKLKYQIRYYLGTKKKLVSELIDSILFRSKTRRVLNLKNKYKNQRCFIIGNGPSINAMDLNLMKNEIVFCSNSFFLKFEDLDFTPSFITVEDHLVAEDNCKVFDNLHGLIKIFPVDLRNTLEDSNETYWIELRRALNNKTKGDNYKFNVEEEIFYWGGTVLYMNLQLAAYMGFKEIYLIGVDLSYSIPKDAEVKGSVIFSKSDDPNHFNPTYFGKGKRWHLPETERMQKSFSNAYDVLNANDIYLYNATVGGNLQNVPRVDYNSLFR